MLESRDESGGLQIGDLIIHLFRRAGEAILSVLPQLLQAMVSRMKSAKTATFLQVSKAVDSYDERIYLAGSESCYSVCIFNKQPARHSAVASRSHGY